MSQPSNFERPLNISQPIGTNILATQPMLRVSEKDYPVSILDRAKLYRASMRKLGITTPDVMEEDD